MRFDQLPSELMIMIAERSDPFVRGCMFQSSRRISAIYGKLPYFFTLHQIRCSCKKVGQTIHNDCKIVEICSEPGGNITIKGKSKSSDYSKVGRISELSFRDMDCGNFSVGHILSDFPALESILNLSFNDCYFFFAGNFLLDLVEKNDVRSIEMSACLCYSNTQKVLNDKFFSSFLGDFNFTINEKKNVTNKEAIVTIQTLTELMKNPRKVFKLENVRCDFTPSYLTVVVKAVISSNWHVDWNLGVIVVPTEELSFFHNGIHYTLVEAALAVNGHYATNIENVEGTNYTEYIITNEHSQVKFMVQHVTENHLVSRKRRYQ